MGLIMRNGVSYFGDGAVELTQAEYDALPTSEKLNGTTYYISDATSLFPAGSISYDNSSSGLVATNAQGAINELTNRNKYSTTEHLVGTWVDGKPIYEVTVRIDSPQYNTTDYVDAMTINNVDVCISTSSTWYRTLSGMTFYYSAVGMICPEKASTSYQLGTRFRKDISKVQYFNAGYNQQMQTVWITTRYTKTTD